MTTRSPSFSFKEPWDGDEVRVDLNLSLSGLRFIAEVLQDESPGDGFTEWIRDAVETVEDAAIEARQSS